MTASVAVREATTDDHGDAMFLLDAAMLEADAGAVRRRVRAGSVLVADADGRVVGVCVLDGREIQQIAVRRERRGRGVGTALVEAAAARVDGPVTAEFADRVRPFYESLGFEIRETEDGSLRGRLR
jgi:GNAT superfamily N-acetyltransferase